MKVFVIGHLLLHQPKPKPKPKQSSVAPRVLPNLSADSNPLGLGIILSIGTFVNTTLGEAGTSGPSHHQSFYRRYLLVTVGLLLVWKLMSCIISPF